MLPTIDNAQQMLQPLAGGGGGSGAIEGEADPEEFRASQFYVSQIPTFTKAFKTSSKSGKSSKRGGKSAKKGKN